MPVHDLAEVKRLAAVRQFELFSKVVVELERLSFDSDDLMEILVEHLREEHWFKSAVTLKYYPGEISDYYSAWIDDCGAQMYIKLLITTFDSNTRRLCVTSFKRDNRYVGRTMRRMRGKASP